jgi:hypothetical protein
VSQNQNQDVEQMSQQDLVDEAEEQGIPNPTSLDLESLREQVRQRREQNRQ